MDILIPLVRNKYEFWFDIDANYCGAAMVAKKPLPGEHWLRGQDCADGRLKHLPRVLWDILLCELGLGRWKSYRRSHTTGAEHG